MTTAIITTDPFFGPWNIPARGQNMINNYYAKSKGLEVDTIIPEPLFSRFLSTTQWVAQNKDLNSIILCSIHQLPDLNSADEELIKLLKRIVLHFSLEDICGVGDSFVHQVTHEKELFSQSCTIEYRNFSTYSELHKLMQLSL